MRDLPSVDDVLRTEPARQAIEVYGRSAAVSAIRRELGTIRASGRDAADRAATAQTAAAGALAQLEVDARPKLRAVFNLTGTVLHTNLGRAVLAEAAVEAATLAMREAIALEFDLARGGRGERDDLVRALLCELTGAEDATIVNNNAGAFLLVLNTLARGRDAIVSRGELIEIGGAFRLPEIIARAGAKLREVGTTNRTHPGDYESAIGPKTGVLLKVHTSNYRIQGFTKESPARDLAALAMAHEFPFVHDLGSGTLVDLSRYGLAREPTVREAVAAGADLVTFSGDKLLGGPQAGFVVGRTDLIARINRNPMKRALRVDKIRLAAIEATLRLYRDPDRLAERLPTLRFLARPRGEIEALAGRLVGAIAKLVGADFTAEVAACSSQIGSGALPEETLPSAAIAVRPVGKRGAGGRLAALAAALRGLPRPVLGRVFEGAVMLDLRCLEDEAGFLDNLAHLRAGERDAALGTERPR